MQVRAFERYIPCSLKIILRVRIFRIFSNTNVRFQVIDIYMYFVRYMVGYNLISRLMVLIILYIFESLRNYTETQTTPTFEEIQPRQMYCALHVLVHCISHKRNDQHVRTITCVLSLF